MTFADSLGELALVPATGGVFTVVLDGEQVFSRKEEGRFPESKELKQLIRDRVDPKMDLGHSDNKIAIKKKIKYFCLIFSCDTDAYMFVAGI